MKKFKILVYLFFIILLFVGIFVLISKKTVETPNQFQKDSNADFYIVGYNSVVGYKIKKNEPHQTSKQSIEVVKGQINQFVQRAELSNRYLVFSEEGPPLGVVGRVISIDFQKGNIKYNQTPNYAYTSSGVSKDYYYASEASTEETFIASFNSNLKQMDKYVLDEPVIVGDFSVDGNKVYFLGTKIVGEGTTSLYTLLNNKGKLELAQKDLLVDDDKYSYSFGDSVVRGSDLFVAVSGYRDNSTHERIPIGSVLHYNLATKEKSFLPLTEIAPINIFNLNEKLIAIEHEKNDLGKIGFSLFNLEDYTSKFIDLSLVGLTVEEHYLKDIKQLDNEILLILAGDRLLVYDISSDEVVYQDDISDKDGFHIWIKQH